MFFIVVLLLLAASAYFSACETAISVASKAKLHHLAKNGSKKAGIAEKLKEEIGPMISAILTCNTALNAMATSLATGLFLALVGQEGIAYASLIMTVLILIYSEVLPKMLAIWAPERLIVRSAYIMKWLLTITRPISRITNWIARGSLMLLGIKLKDQDTSAASFDELRGVIDLHRGPDQDAIQERIMLKSILDLRSVQVSKIMIHRKNVTALNADDSIESIIDQVSASPFSRLPLWEGDSDNVIGIVNVKVLLRAVRAGDIKNLNVRTIASKPWFIPESTDLLEQLQEFKKRKEHFALVVDEYGALLGAVTLEDILEEIVGEIDDEHDISVNGVRVQPDNSVIVDGSVTIRDLNRRFDWSLPDDIAATVAGLLINTVRVIPNIGQLFILYGFRFTVLKKQRNQITLIKITKCGDLL
ncbi:MAG: HlyC/CorC family transporter [Holosporales bacterium]|jgi:Mg2+/Co2+ transporter CorB|nr:HlyC/CorC family transporter [Holosporales bacterium]